MRRSWGVTSGAVLVCGLAVAAPAETTVCPIDGARLPRPSVRPWNAGGGVDSDGCTWSIAADGRRSVVGLDLIECPGCAAAFPAGDVPRALPPTAIAALRGALGGPAPAALVGRHERAAELRRVVLELGDLRPADHAQLGTAFLRAAWAARQEAVLGGPDGGYRPRSIPAAREHLEALEERVRRGGDQDPAAAQLELAAADLDGLRRALAGLEQHARGPDLMLVARARHLLAAAERRVSEARARLAAGAPSEAGAELVLARGWTRFGDVARRERWLEAALARHGEVIAAEVARTRQACAEEARLLRMARASFEAAAPGQAAPERARLLFLAGDAARRAGDLDDGRRLLTAAVEADPEGRLAQAARALVER